jgi:spore coat polysaccharide biosynthesis protein SpsF
METTTEFWAGTFGDEYGRRNRVVWEHRIPFWRRILEITRAKTFCEAGVNAGWNFQAIRRIDPEASMSGVDVNQSAIESAQEFGFDVMKAPASDVATLFGPSACDMSLTSGVLIHVAPDDLKATMQALIDVSSKWVLAVEYAADEEVAITYREHKGRLWKRPFGKLYEDLGLDLFETGPAEGFMDCQYWLLSKP